MIVLTAKVACCQNRGFNRLQVRTLDIRTTSVLRRLVFFGICEIIIVRRIVLFITILGFIIAMNPQESVPSITPQPPASTPVPVSAPQTTSSAGNTNLTGPVELLSSSWKFFRIHWKILVSIVILPSIISFVAQTLLITSAGNPIAAILSFILIVVAIVLGIVMQPAAINAIHRLTTESGTLLTLKGQYKIGLTYFWSIVFLIILQVFITLGSFVLFVIPAIILSVYTGMYVFTRIIDGKRGFSAFTENYSLVKGRWWKVLGRLLFMILVYIVASLIMIGVVFILNLIFGFDSKSEGGTIISTFVSMLPSAFLGPLALVYLYRLYTSLKNTRVGEVSTGAFKKWLVAFLCIGIASVVIIFITIPIVAVATGSAQMKALKAKQTSEAKILEIQRQIESANLQDTGSSIQVEIPKAI